MIHVKHKSSKDSATIILFSIYNTHTPYDDIKLHYVWYSYRHSESFFRPFTMKFLKHLVMTKRFLNFKVMPLDKSFSAQQHWTMEFLRHLVMAKRFHKLQGHIFGQKLYLLSSTEHQPLQDWRNIQNLKLKIHSSSNGIKSNKFRVQKFSMVNAPTQIDQKKKS